MPKVPKDDFIGVENLFASELVFELTPVRASIPTAHAVGGTEANENDIYTDEDIEAALSHFRKQRNVLERDSLNHYVAVDVATGNMTVASTHIEAVDAFEAKFGPAKTLTFHIGTTY